MLPLRLQRDLVSQAVEKDGEGDYKAAIQLYCDALAFFVPAIHCKYGCAHLLSLNLFFFDMTCVCVSLSVLGTSFYPSFHVLLQFTFACMINSTFCVSDEKIPAKKDALRIKVSVCDSVRLLMVVVY